MSGEYSEDKLVQKTTIDYFKYNLDWETVYAYNTEKLGVDGTLGRKSEKEVVLVRYLKQALKKFNPGLPDDAYENAIEIITENNLSKTLIDINEEKYKLFKDGVKVQFKDNNGKLVEQRLKVFNFREPEKNSFIAVRELWIQGSLYRRRADIIGFVNGIPLLFVELKNVHKDIQDAYEDNFTDYKDTIPHLFNYNAIVMLSNGIEGKVGAVTSKYEYFNEWKRLKEEEEGSVDFEVMLKGICSKENFMDIFENFILFDDSSGQKVKILAMNHQFLGVNKVIESFKESKKDKNNKLGVFWHTQGSGKSYSIVFFCQKVLRCIKGNHSFLIVTDRKELDEQIYNTFVGVGAVKPNSDVWASNGEHLRQLLGEDQRYIFSLIHKFNEKVKEPYKNTEDLIVISDEAHRTQYGLLAKNMRDALPKAKFLGFTGTPLLSGDELTKEFFGDYVSIYDFDRAVKDGATVPLYYQSRGEKLHIVNDELNRKLQDKIDEFNLSDEEEKKLRTALSKEYHIITSNERLDTIAKDIVEHYSTMWESGKAMLVCIDKITCVRMYNLIDKYWKEKIQAIKKDINQCLDIQDKLDKQKQIKWLEETEYAVVISEEQNEMKKFKEWGLDIIPHREKMKRGIKREGYDKARDLATEFKDSKSPFRLAIVCAMWLTGFDVKSLSILYLDKVLKEHTLMQTIARANRVDEGKNNGLIIDYIGVLKNLRQALAKYGSGIGEGGEKPPAGTDEDLLNDLKKSIGLTKSHLKENNYDLDELINADGFKKIGLIEKAEEVIYTNKEIKNKFEILARDVQNKYKACLFMDEINKITPEHDAIKAIYNKIQDNKRKTDISNIILELHNIVDETIKTENIAKNGLSASKLFDISNIDFDILKEEFRKSPRKNTVLYNMKKQIEYKLEKMIKQNPTRMDFYKKYKKIIEDYNYEKDRAVIEETFEALLKFVNDLSGEEKRAAKEGLSEEDLALFDLLEKSNLNSKDREKLKQISKDLLEKLKKLIEGIDNWQEKIQSQAKVKVTIDDYLTKYLPESYGFDEISKKRDVVYNYLFENYTILSNNTYSMYN